MDKEKLINLKDLAEKATPLPWANNFDGIICNNLLLAIGEHSKAHILGQIIDTDNANYIAAANPQAILELIEDAQYADVLQNEKDAYYQEFDKLAEYLGVFKETDPGKPETFSVFRREFEKLKKENERLQTVVNCYKNANDEAQEIINELKAENARLEEDFEDAARSAADESVKVVKLEEEADWLAAKLVCASTNGKQCDFGEGCICNDCKNATPTDWRAAAREAVAEKAEQSDIEPR